MRFPIVLVLLAVSSQFFLLSTAHPAGWDEAVYIGMAKFLYSAGQSGLWESIRPPLLPALLGLPWLLGIPIVVAGELLGIIVTTATSLLIYATARKYMTELPSFLAGALFLITPVVVQNSSLLMTGMIATFFAMLAIYLHDRPAESGVAAALSFLARFPLGLVGAALAVLTLRKPISFIKFALGASLVGIPFLLANMVAYRAQGLLAPLFPLLEAAPHQGNPVHAASNIWSSVIFYPMQLFLDNPLLLLALPGFYLFIRKKQWHIVLPFLFLFTYFTLIPNKQLRFAIVFLPMLTIFAAYALAKFHRVTSARFPKHAVNAFVGFVVLVSLATSANVSAEHISWLPSSTERPSFELNADAVILTIDPRFTADYDNKFIPFYDNPFTGEAAFDNAIDSVDVVIYTEEFFPCFTQSCTAQLQKLNQKVRSQEHIQNVSMYNANFELYLTK